MENKQFTRRDVLKLAGKGLAGVAVASAVPSILTGCGEKKTELPSKEVIEYVYKEKSEDAITGPYPYQKLDVATTMERGHAGFYNVGNCCNGAADALIGQLADETGYPFNQIPITAFAPGGGGFGAGTMCGSLAAAVSAIGLVCEPDDAKIVIGELFDWYKNTPLPEYQPDMEVVKVEAKSVNCSDSVGKFMKETGTKMGDAERKERCACITGDVAGKTAELLNKHFGLA